MRCAITTMCSDKVKDALREAGIEIVGIEESPDAVIAGTSR